MPIENVSIAMRKGECRAYVLPPHGKEPWPAILFYMDAGGIRPATFEMAQRVADMGYVVLLPDLFYRYGPYKTIVPKELFKDDIMAVLGPLMATTGNDRAAEDTASFINYLDTRDDVVRDKFGAVGFCMGGGMAITAAGTYPERFAAVASFHGGNLATDSPTSPHLVASRLSAEVYVAGADKDDLYPPEMASRLANALDNAGVRYRAETYVGSAHGWMTTDFPVYDPIAAERGWAEMKALFGRNLLSQS
jgi:carboxymethylenebutenolidase